MNLQTIRLSAAYVLVFCASAVVFLRNIGHESVWYDEALTLHMLRPGFFGMLHEVAFGGVELNPPLFHISLKFISSLFGDSVSVLRSVSALWACLLALVLFRFIKREIGLTVVAFAGSVLFITTPIVVTYAQEMRMYTMATCFAFIGLSAFYTAIGKERRVRTNDALIYTVASIVGCYTHYYYFLCFVVTCVFFLYVLFCRTKAGDDFRKKLISFYLASHTVIALAFLPWAPALRSQVPSASAVGWSVNVDWGTTYQMFRYFFTSKFGMEANPVISAWMSVGMFLGVLAVSLVFLVRSKRFQLIHAYALGSFVLPVAVGFAVAKVSGTEFNYRYMILFLPFLLVFFVLGLREIAAGSRWLFVALVGWFVAINVPAILTLHSQHFKGSGRETAQYLREHVQAGELVVFDQVATFLTASYYLEYPGNLYYYSPLPLHRIFGTELRPGYYLEGRQLRDLVAAYRRKPTIWLVTVPWSVYAQQKTLDVFARRIDYEVDESFGIQIFENPKSVYKGVVRRLLPGA
jgi:uncharacterized membrane protein